MKSVRSSGVLVWAVVASLGAPCLAAEAPAIAPAAAPAPPASAGRVPDPVPVPDPAPDPAPAAPASTTDSEMFQRHFGTRYKEVMAAPTRDAVTKLAKEMLAAARAAEGNPAMAALLCDRAYDVGGRDPVGYPLAIQSMEILAAVDPLRAAEASGKAIEIRKKQYYATKGKDRAAVGEQVIDDLLKLADEDLRANRTDRSIKLCQDALQIATQIRSDQHEAARLGIERATARQKNLKLIDQYKEQLRANPKDAALAEKMILAYVVDLDEPAEARQYTFLLADGPIKTNLTHIGQGLAAMSIPDLLSAGDWYTELAGTAAVAAKMSLLMRSQSYYEAAVAQGAEGLELTKAKLCLTALEQSMEKLTAKSPAPLARSTVLSAAFHRTREGPLLDSRRKPITMLGEWNWAADDAFEKPTEVVDFVKGAATWPSEEALMLHTGGMTAWIKFRGKGSLNGLICKGSPGYEGHSDYGMQIDWAGNLVSYMGWPATSDNTRSTLPPLPENEWVFVAYAWDEKQFSLWINGKPSGPLKQRAPFKLTPGPLDIGQDTPGANEFFHGRIASFNLYNVYLDDKQVKDLMAHQMKSMKLKPPKPTDPAAVPTVRPITPK